MLAYLGGFISVLLNIASLISLLLLLLVVYIYNFVYNLKKIKVYYYN